MKIHTKELQSARRLTLRTFNQHSKSSQNQNPSLRFISAKEITPLLTVLHFVVHSELTICTWKIEGHKLPRALFRRTSCVLGRENTKDRTRLRDRSKKRRVWSWGERGGRTEIAVTFRGLSEGSRNSGGGRREGGQPQRRAGSEQVTGSSAPSSAVPRHGHSRSTP